ncbi:MAG: TAXI family TRAP transporter solute-binding subunit, partial [Spirochaetota bacterium]
NIGMANAAAVYNGVNATGPFEGQPAAEGVRGVAAIAIAPLHWVTLAGSGIENFEDLVGKRVSVGKAGSGTAANAELSLELMGLLDEIRPQFLGFDESADSMRDGNTDVFAASSSIPMPAVASVATTRDIRLLSYSDAQIEDLLGANPAFQPYTIPAGTYNGVDSATLTFGVPSTLIINENVPEDVVYDLVMMMYSDAFTSYMRAAYKSYEPSPASSLFETIGGDRCGPKARYGQIDERPRRRLRGAQREHADSSRKHGEPVLGLPGHHVDVTDLAVKPVEREQSVGWRYQPEPILVADDDPYVAERCGLDDRFEREVVTRAGKRR